MSTGPYPAWLSIDFPENGLSRLSVLFRPILLIPSLVLFPFIMIYWALRWPLLVLFILFTGTYPRGWFDLEISLAGFWCRYAAFAWLLTDRWPFIPLDHPVQLQVEYPDEFGKLNRFLPLIKWLLVVPHWLILIPVVYAVSAVWLVFWMIAIILGRLPRGLFRFLSGMIGWSFRVSAYSDYLFTDQYPSFGFSSDA